MTLVDFAGDLVLMHVYLISKKYQYMSYNEHNITMIKHVIERAIDDIMYAYRHEYAHYELRMVYSARITSFDIEVMTVHGRTDVYFHLEC